MRKTKWVCVALTVMLLAGVAAAGSVSTPVMVDATSGYRHWMTVYTNEVSLRWQWSEEAISARLEIAGMDGTFTTNFAEAVSHCVWQVFAADVPVTEDVYDLALTFYGDGEAVIETLAAQLAVIKGAHGATTVDISEDSKSWTRVRNNMVIPYDSGWTSSLAAADSAELVITGPDDLVQTNVFNDAAGYYGWQLRNSKAGYGTFALSLTFPETDIVWQALLERLPEGTMILVH